MWNCLHDHIPPYFTSFCWLRTSGTLSPDGEKSCENLNNMPQDIFCIDPTQIKAKILKENFSCRLPSPALQVCEIQLSHDKHLKFWASTNILLLYSPFTVQDPQHQSKMLSTLRKTALLDSQSSSAANCPSISAFIGGPVSLQTI